MILALIKPFLAQALKTFNEDEANKIISLMKGIVIECEEAEGCANDIIKMIPLAE